MDEVDKQGAEFLQRLLPHGLKEVAQARGGRGHPILEAEKAAPSHAVFPGEQLFQASPAQVEFPPQAKTEEEGDRVIRDLATAAGSIAGRSQEISEGGEVDEAEGDLKSGEGGESGGVREVVRAQITVLGTVVSFGGRGDVLRNGEGERKAVSYGRDRESGDEIRVSRSFLDGGGFDCDQFHRSFLQE